MLPEKSNKLKTTVKKNTTDPVYNEVLKVERKILFNCFNQSVWCCIMLDLIRFNSVSCLRFSQYHIERHLLLGKRLQASVWHSGSLKRKVFLGEVLIPLDGWRFEDKASQCINWYPLCPKVKQSRYSAVILHR